MLPDTGIDDVKMQRNAEYAKHINDLVLSSLKLEGIRLLSSEQNNYINLSHRFLFKSTAFVCCNLFIFLFFIFCCGAATQRGSWPPHS
jgi:hypothetical protein